MKKLNSLTVKNLNKLVDSIERMTTRELAFVVLIATETLEKQARDESLTPSLRERLSKTTKALDEALSGPHGLIPTAMSTPYAIHA